MTGLPCCRARSASSSFDKGRCRAPGIFSRACSSASRMSIRTAPLSRRRCASDGLMVGSDMISSYFFSAALRLDRPAKQPVQRGEELFDARIGDAVPERLAFAPESDEALLAHLSE